ncbi:hypothetical protein FRC20_000276 [Serendipita sp. 405]|nr:hypothetical protein FRC20_000276 [Serendipita sp. 405]
MSAGVPGHALEIYSPPAEVHFAVAMHTPGAPLLPVHFPLTSDTAASGAESTTSVAVAPEAKKELERATRASKTFMGIGFHCR